MKKYTEYLPDEKDQYKVSFDSNLLEHGKVIFNYLEENNLFTPRVYNDIKWRDIFGWYDEFELNNYFKEHIVDYLGLNNINEVRFERTFAHPDLNSFHLTRSRYKGIKESEQRSKSKPRGFSSFYFHCDESFPLSNYKMIINLNDVSTGGTFVSDPVLVPVSKDGEVYFHEDIIPSSSITEKEITGKAGSIYCASSHILHRASLPKQGYTDKMHLSFTVSDNKLIAKEYIKGQSTYEFLQDR